MPICQVYGDNGDAQPVLANKSLTGQVNAGTNGVRLVIKYHRWTDLSANVNS